MMCICDFPFKVWLCTARAVGIREGVVFGFGGRPGPARALPRPFSARFGSAWPSSARLRLAQLGTAQLGSARPSFRPCPAWSRVHSQNLFCLEVYRMVNFCFGGWPGLAQLSSPQPGLARLSSAFLGHKMDSATKWIQTRPPFYG